MTYKLIFILFKRLCEGGNPGDPGENACDPCRSKKICSDQLFSLRAKEVVGFDGAPIGHDKAWP